jgi:hypothetical protein
VRHAFANAFLSLLLLATLVGGGCISCEQYFMWPGAKSCCSPNGHCKTNTGTNPGTKTPPSQQSNRQCNQIAFDHHKSVDFPIDLPVIAVLGIELPKPTNAALEHWHGAILIESSPPDLQILHSTFLI